MCVRKEYGMQRTAVYRDGRRMYWNEQLWRQPYTTVSYSNEEAEDSMTAPDRTPRFTELHQLSEAFLLSVSLCHRHLNVSFSLTFP